MVTPFLAFILLIAIDFCRLFFAYTTITNAARNGALWASDPLANGTVTPSQSQYTSVTAAALADANNLNPALTTLEYHADERDRRQRKPDCHGHRPVPIQSDNILFGL